MLARQFLAIAAIGILGVTAIGCGDDDDGVGTSAAAGSAGAAGNAGAGGDGGAAGDTPGCETKESCAMQPGNEHALEPLTKPADPPASGETPGADTNTQAVKALHLGDTDIDPESPSYKDLGFDIDGVNSTPTWGFHCKAPKSAQKEVRQDGTNGIDNMFSKKIITTLAGLAGDSLAGLSDNIAKGSFSVVVTVKGLEASGSNYTKLDSKLYAVHGLKNDDGTNQPVTDFSTYEWDPFDVIKDGIAFPNSYMNNHVWVSGTPTEIPLTLDIGGASLDLHIYSGVVQAKYNSTNSATTEGVIAGALKTQDVLDQVPVIAAALGQCDLSSFQSALDSFKNFSDIYLDDSGKIVLDPTKDCNAMSVGIGFETVASKLKDNKDPEATPGKCPPM